jgi:hypothetical protein
VDVTLNGAPLDEATGVTLTNIKNIPAVQVRNVKASKAWESAPRRRSSRVSVGWDVDQLAAWLVREEG